jgi:hypothetical protein
MRRVWPWIVLSVGLPFLLSIAAGARQGGTPQSTASQAAVAIRNVTVIPATGAAPITGATVVIIGDRISALGPASSTVIPKQARIVDGAGKFLMPGLIGCARIRPPSVSSRSSASAFPLPRPTTPDA